MCKFVSWIEKDGVLWYLTDKDIQSKRGKEYRDYNPCRDDDRGHGAIRWFYDLKGGKERECFDFSTPSNFPSEIVEAIKQGNFSRWFGPVPDGLLVAPLYAEYGAKVAPLYADYQAKRAPLDYQTWLLVTESQNRSEAWR